MPNVIDSKMISRIQIEIDDYIPLSCRCVDMEVESLFYWRTGDFKSSLLEIGINPKDGTLLRIKMPLAGKVYQVLNYKTIKEIENIPSVEGIPIVDISNFELNNIQDETREIKVDLGYNSLIIYLKKDIFPTKIFYVENVKFGVDSAGNLVLIAFVDISEAGVLKIKEDAISLGMFIDQDRLESF